MFAVIHDHLGNPLRIPCTRATLEDNFGNTISVGLEHGPNQYFCSHIGEGPRFKRALVSLGIKDTTIVDEIGPDAAPQPQGRLILPSEELPGG